MNVSDTSTCAYTWDNVTLGWISVSTIHYSQPSLSLADGMYCRSSWNNLIRSLDSPSEHTIVMVTHIHMDTVYKISFANKDVSYTTQ